jgi:outer membrane protein, multidrug efflux system
MFRQRIIFLFLTTALISCSSYLALKSNEAPTLKLQTPVPENWSSGADIDESVQVAPNGWIKEFNDAQIATVAAAVIANNQNLVIAAANVDAAAASARKAGAALKPSADLKLTDKTQASFDSSETKRSFGASVDISWELDVWGKLRASKAKAVSSLEASQADYAVAKESLLAQAVKSYLYAIEAYLQKEVSKKAKDSYEKDLKVIEAFYQAGSKTKQDVYIAKADFALSEADFVKAQNSYIEALRSLELLLGQYPAGKYAVAEVLPEEPRGMTAGVPADILEQRPDIRSSERQVAAAFNATQMAKAARLPSIALTSAVGSSSDDLRELSDPTNLFWNFAGNLLAPLFDGGKLAANVEIADSAQVAAVAAYQAAALNAFKEVETALGGEQSLRQRIELLKLNYEQAKLAYEFTSSKYLQGEGNILDVSQLKRNMIVAESDLISAKQDLLAERVNLYLALGVNAL